MKKYLLILFSLTLLIGISACGEDKPQENEKKEVKIENESETSEKVDKETKENKKEEPNLTLSDDLSNDDLIKELINETYFIIDDERFKQFIALATGETFKQEYLKDGKNDVEAWDSMNDYEKTVYTLVHTKPEGNLLSGAKNVYSKNRESFIEHCWNKKLFTDCDEEDGEIVYNAFLKIWNLQWDKWEKEKVYFNIFDNNVFLVKNYIDDEELALLELGKKWRKVKEEQENAEEEKETDGSEEQSSSKEDDKIVDEEDSTEKGEKEMSKNPVVIISTKIGDKELSDMKLELYPEKAPNTVANFVTLANDGYYDGLTFHRIIKGFMIQGGDPDGIGTGGPGYSIAGEFSGNGFENDVQHDRGVISMARSQHPDSAGSQFFICHLPAPHLDGQYAAFGKLIEGEDALDELAETPTGFQDVPESKCVMTKIVVEMNGYELPEVVKK